MDNVSIPKSIKPELEKLGLKLSEIIFCCYADLTPDASFGSTWAVSYTHLNTNHFPQYAII